MAKSVALADGESDTMQLFCIELAEASAELNRGNVSALSESAATNRRDFFIFLLCVRRVRWTTEKNPQRPLLTSRADLKHLLAQGDLALRHSFECRLQLRDSVGISPTSLTRGTSTLSQVHSFDRVPAKGLELLALERFAEAGFVKFKDPVGELGVEFTV